MIFKFFQPKKKFKSHLGYNLEGKPTNMTIINGTLDKPIIDLTIHITEKCNFSCRHCYVSSNPSVKDQLLKEDIISVIKQSSKYNCSGILFTGGEPFLHPDLNSILKYTKRRINPIHIFTNGSWVSDFETTINRLKELKELGCDHIKFSTEDKYHREFMQKEKIEVINQIIGINDGQMPVLELNHEKDSVDPQGVALNLPPDALKLNDPENILNYNLWFDYCKNFLRFMINEVKLIIRANGDVYPCNFYVKKIGNIKKDSISNLVKAFFSDADYKLIAEKGPQELARKKEIPEEEIKKRFLEHPCKFCHDLLNE